MVKIDFFYDIVSPYSYLAFEVLERYRESWKLDLVMRPAFLAGVFKATGNEAPAVLPSRGAYLAQDLRRAAKYFDLPLGFPEDFPANTLSTMRLLSLVADERPERLLPLSRAFWQRSWRDSQEVSKPDSMRAVCAAVDVDPALVDRIGEQAVKDRLKAHTDEAVARGAFGFPAMLTVIDGDEQLFFGSDRLNVMAFELGLPWHGPQPSRR
ncbi:MAG: DsbA family protein [Deltaproteobacteria bacterium]|nr:DsbA family protein [Deltaproteobacteria bacterium]